MSQNYVWMSSLVKLMRKYLVENKEYKELMATEPLARQSSILGLIVAANLSDSTYGRGFELSNESFCATRSLKTVFGDHS